MVWGGSSWWVGALKALCPRCRRSTLARAAALYALLHAHKHPPRSLHSRVQQPHVKGGAARGCVLPFCLQGLNGLPAVLAMLRQVAARWQGSGEEIACNG